MNMLPLLSRIIDQLPTHCNKLLLTMSRINGFFQANHIHCRIDLHTQKYIWKCRTRQLKDHARVATFNLGPVCFRVLCLIDFFSDGEKLVLGSLKLLQTYSYNEAAEILSQGCEKSWDLRQNYYTQQISRKNNSDLTCNQKFDFLTKKHTVP